MRWAQGDVWTADVAFEHLEGKATPVAFKVSSNLPIAGSCTGSILDSNWQIQVKMCWKCGGLSTGSCSACAGPGQLLVLQCGVLLVTMHKCLCGVEHMSLTCSAPSAVVRGWVGADRLRTAALISTF
jgi:hypothetical protein